MATRFGRRPNSGFYGLVRQVGPWPETRVDKMRRGGYQADNYDMIQPGRVGDGGKGTGLSDIAQRHVVDRPTL